ncbi:MAG: hypothetical protein OEV87_05435 [Phycisphaerae bacterium]|nr:hypothetical protein [Phycisphaerae bacterium]
MNTSTGWIKLYRCLLDDPLWQCSTSEQKNILVTLLLMANHAEKKWQWNGQPYTCQPGQMITSLNSIQEKCGKQISIQKIRTALLRFEKMGFLNKQSNTESTLITICNWRDYQSYDGPVNIADNTRVTIASQTDNKHLTPNKNVKNEKNEKTHMRDDFYLSSGQKEIQRIREANARAMQKFLKGEDRSVSNKPAGLEQW